jgi:hypothetical protein
MGQWAHAERQGIREKMQRLVPLTVNAVLGAAGEDGRAERASTESRANQVETEER